MRSISIDLYGVRAKVHSDDEAFLRFVASNYRPFLTEQEKPVDLQVYFSEKLLTDISQQAENMPHLGGGARGLDDRLYWENPFLFRILTRIGSLGPEEVWAYHGDLCQQENEEERRKNYQRSMRWALHFPLFIQLKQKQNKHLIHACAVQSHGKAWLLFGHNKVGKSSLGMYLSQHGDFNLMSDNFLLYDETHVYGFPECSRLSEASASELGLQPSKTPVYGKGHYETETSKECLIARPEAVFFLQEGKEHKVDSMKKLDVEALTVGIHQFLGEFPQHSFYSFLPLFGIKGRSLRRASTLDSRIWYRLRQPLNWNFLGTVNAIESCLSPHTAQSLCIGRK